MNSVVLIIRIKKLILQHLIKKIIDFRIEVKINKQVRID